MQCRLPIFFCPNLNQWFAFFEQPLKAEKLPNLPHAHVSHGPVGERQAHRENHQRVHPGGGNGVDDEALRNVFAENADDDEQHEEHDGDEQWPSKPALANDGAHRCSHEQKDKASQRQTELGVELKYVLHPGFLRLFQ